MRDHWHVLEPRSRPFIEGWHLEVICEHLEAVTAGELTRVLFNVPPGAMKSMLVDVFWPAWEWGPQDMPATRYLCTSYTDKLTTRDNLRFLRVIESDSYQEKWGDRFAVTHRGEQKIQNDQTGWKIATSVGGLGTGERGDRVIFDDLHNVKEAESDLVRQGAVDYFNETLSDRVNDPDRSAFVGIMQRVHEADVSGEIYSRDLGYTKVMIPMEFDSRRSFVNGFGWQDPRTEDGDLYWPERFPRQVVERMKFQLGPYAVAAQYQQEPAPRGGGIIKVDWWQMWPPGGEKDDTSLKPAQFPDLEYVCASVDTAMTEDSDNDESALTLWGIFREPSSVLREGGIAAVVRDQQFALRDDGVALVGEMPSVMLPRVILLYSWSGRVQFHDLVLKIIEVCDKRKVDALLVEAKNTGMAVVQEIQRLMLDQKWVTYGQPVKGDKTARLYSVQHLFSSGMVFAPDRTWAQRVISQCEVYPKGRHDDLVDTTSQALQYLRGAGLLALKDEAQIDAQRQLLAVPRGGDLERRAPYDV